MKQHVAVLNALFSHYAIMRFIPTSSSDLPTELKSRSLSASSFPGAASAEDACSKALDEEDLPPLGFKVTGYRLLNIAVIIGFGIFKAIRVYCGQPLTPSILELVGGTLLTLMYASFSLHFNIGSS